MSLIVMGGVVSLSGIVENSLQKEGARVAAETTRGVKEVRNNIGIMPSNVWAGMGVG
jgi:osmotically-inducible protein OsmY